MRILFVVLLACSAAAAAQSNPPQEDLGTLLGLGVRSRPDYDGASKQEVEPIPVIRYYGKALFARTYAGHPGSRRAPEFLPGYQCRDPARVRSR
jgi:outer membrane scaffolding protein for murein synthesis (MipA/OmpV family)